MRWACHWPLRWTRPDSAETINGATVPNKAPKKPPFWTRAFLVLTLALGRAMARRVVLCRQSLFFWTVVSLIFPFKTLKEHSNMAFIRPGSAPTISCFTNFGLAWASAQRRWACRLRLDGRTFAWDVFCFFLLSVLFMTSVEMNAELPVTEGYMTPPLTMARAFGKSLSRNKVFLRRKCSGVDWLKSITM